MIISRRGFHQCSECGIWTDTAFAVAFAPEIYCAKHTPTEGRSHEEQAHLLSSIINPRDWI